MRGPGSQGSPSLYWLVWVHLGRPLSRSLCGPHPEGASGRGTAGHGEGRHTVQVPAGQPGARVSALLPSKAHPRPCQPAVDVEQVPEECPRHQEDPGCQPAAALQGASRDSCRMHRIKPLRSRVSRCSFLHKVITKAKICRRRLLQIFILIIKRTLKDRY